MAEPHLMIHVDERPLDELLAAFSGQDYITGLVPTWLGWMTDDSEQAEVDTRSQTTGSFPRILPVLICPDDLDLSCTTIVTEITVEGDCITWLRTGLDQTKISETQIDWLTSIPSFSFARQDYIECLEAFQKSRRQKTEPCRPANAAKLHR